MAMLNTLCKEFVDILNQRILLKIKERRSSVAIVTKTSTQRSVWGKGVFKILNNLLQGAPKLLFFFLLCAMPSYLGAQLQSKCDLQIIGVVYDYQTKEPLPFVSIQIENTALGTTSDEKGNFSFRDLCENEYDLVFNHIGYKDARHHHDFHHPERMEVFMVEDQVLLDGVVVESTGSQANLNTTNNTKISGEALKQVQSESLGEVVSNISGVSMITTGQNITVPVIHGLHSNRILMINNGIRHEFQNWGIDHAPEIDPSLSNEIEIVKGAGTVRFGPDALGGVILVSPKRLEMSSPLRGSVKVLGKSNGRSGESSVEFSKGFKWLSFGGNASILKQGDLTAPDYLLTNTGKEEQSYSGRFRIHPSSAFDIEGFYSRFKQNIGILSGSVFGNLDDLERAIESEPPLLTESFSYDIDQPRQDIIHDLFKANARYIGKNQAISLRYGYQVNQRKEFGVRRGDAPNIDLRLVTHSLDLDWSHPKIGPFTGKFGVQWLEQSNDNLPGTNTVPFIPNYDQERLGIYLIENLEWGNNLLELGLRYDYLDSYIVGREPDNTIYRNNVLYRNLSGTIGFKRDFGSNESFQSNLGTAWRAPNVAELYRFGQHSFFLEYGLWRYTIDERFDFVVTTEGILDQTDRPVPAEVGYKWINTYSINRQKFEFNLTAYVNYIENFINSKPGGFTRTPRGVFIYYIYDQTDALFWGIDISGEWRHNSMLESQLRGSYLWAKQIKDNDFFVEQPPANISYQLTFRPKIKWFDKTRFQISANYTFEQFQHPRIISVEDFLNAFQLDLNRFSEDAADFDIVPPPPGYLLVDIGWTASLNQLDFQFQVKNVFDTSYRSYTDRLRYFADGLGRNIIVGVGWNF